MIQKQLPDLRKKKKWEETINVHVEVARNISNVVENSLKPLKKGFLHTII